MKVLGTWKAVPDLLAVAVAAAAVVVFVLIGLRTARAGPVMSASTWRSITARG